GAKPRPPCSRRWTLDRQCPDTRVSESCPSGCDPPIGRSGGGVLTKDCRAAWLKLQDNLFRLSVVVDKISLFHELRVRERAISEHGGARGVKFSVKEKRCKEGDELGKLLPIEARQVAFDGSVSSRFAQCGPN